QAEAAATEKARAAQAMSDRAEKLLSEAENARADTQTREADARAERSAAEGEANALRTETAALARLLDRDTTEGGQILDRLQVQQGFEKALGAALADDLRAPEVAADGPSGWAILPAYDSDQPLPPGVTALTHHVSVPDVLARRMSQIGLVEADEGSRLQPLLKPGQRLVSPEGDLWRWDGYRAWSEDMPSAAALRLEQLNRLEALKQESVQAEARLAGARSAHDSLQARLADLTRADKSAREARREADQELTAATRAVSRAEADRNMAEGKLENLRLAVSRHADDATEARKQKAEAEAAMADLGDLDAARAKVEDVKVTVEAARMTMMARRSAHDETRREGEARAQRREQISRELATWSDRLATARTRGAELLERRDSAQGELARAAG
ncbi:chromosome segregation protein SMC, partial [Litorisediminicola beolgyonensis]